MSTSTDPRFPDRPTHPDFERLAAIARRQDEIADADGEVDMMLSDLGVDPTSVAYLAMNRGKAMCQHTHMPPEYAALVAAGIVDGLTIGINFEKGR